MSKCYIPIHWFSLTHPSSQGSYLSASRVSNRLITSLVGYIIKMIKQGSSKEAPIYKKIQNYIFKFSDLLGQGNFSKVYRAHHEVTSTQEVTETKWSPSKSYNWSPSKAKNSKNYSSQRSMYSKSWITPMSSDASKSSQATGTAI